MHELHEFDIVAYVGPFLEVIQSEATSGELTAVALEAVDKFALRPVKRCLEGCRGVLWPRFAG